jgi:ammonium transporter Rh
LINTGTNEADYKQQDLEAASTMARLYPFFQDLHVMIFIGFGFLMVFLKTHCWTSIGFNFIVACWAIQLNIVVQPAWRMMLVDGIFEKITIDIESLISADFAAAAVLVTFGAVLGKCNWGQLFTLATLEVIFYGLNKTVCIHFFGAVDLGSSMYVHMFGAYFGLVSTYFFNSNRAIRD